MPVRKVSGRGGNIIGRFPSLKLNRMVDFESTIERDFIFLLDFEKDVTWFAEQPLTIQYQHGEKTRTYTPDFQVVRNGQNILVECKPQQFIDKNDNQRKFAAGQTWGAANGCDFQIITDEQLKRGYRLYNVKLLTQFARYNIAPEVKRRIRAFLSITPSPIIIADVMAKVARHEPQSLLVPIYHMAFHDELALPLDDAPISIDSAVSLPTSLQEGRGS